MTDPQSARRETPPCIAYMNAWFTRPEASSGYPAESIEDRHRSRGSGWIESDSGPRVRHCCVPTAEAYISRHGGDRLHICAGA